MSDDRLAWIYSAATPDELRDRYEIWASDYDDDLAALSWRAPWAGAERCAAFLPPGGEVLDAGCGTGQVGAALRSLRVDRVVGFDLSPAMLARAGATGAYTETHQGSLLAPLPFLAGRFDGVVSVGVFTCGHVGPEALGALARVTVAGGHVTLTFRSDSIGPLGYANVAERLEAEGVWTLVECTDPAPLLVEDGVGVDMIVMTWQVGPAS